jgi:hypothetical protein
MGVNRFLSINFGALGTLQSLLQGCLEGFWIKHNSWELESNAPEIVADYWKRQAGKQAGFRVLVLA